MCITAKLPLHKGTSYGTRVGISVRYLQTICSPQISLSGTVKWEVLHKAGWWKQNWCLSMQLLKFTKHFKDLLLISNTSPTNLPYQASREINMGGECWRLACARDPEENNKDTGDTVRLLMLALSLAGSLFFGFSVNCSILQPSLQLKHFWLLCVAPHGARRCREHRSGEGRQFSLQVPIHPWCWSGHTYSQANFQFAAERAHSNQGSQSDRILSCNKYFQKINSFLGYFLMLKWLFDNQQLQII